MTNFFEDVLTVPWWLPKRDELYDMKISPFDAVDIKSVYFISNS
jgi:hypothetical protein